jgi:thiol-disulfide isomerase/thioredoxin
MALSKNNSPQEPVEKQTFWTTGRIVLTICVLGLIGMLGVSSCNSSDVANNSVPANRPVNAPPANTTQPPPPAASLELPQQMRDTKLQTLDGGSLKLSDFADKVLIVNIWATWCGPCKQEMPELVRISNEYKARGLVVLGLATTYNEQQGQDYVKEFVKAQNVPYKIIWDDGTLAAPLVQLVQGKSVIPQSFIISRSGKIVKHFQGFNPYSTPQLMRQAVEEALNDKTKA